MPSRRIMTALALVMLVTIAGCAGPLGGTDESDAPADDVAVDDDAAVAMEADSADVDAEDAADRPADEPDIELRERDGVVAERDLIHTGEIELRVEDVTEASTEIRQLTADRGGFISAAHRQVHEDHDETWRSERLVIRVPSEEFDGTVGDIEDFGEVESAHTNTEDVTDELVDIEARLENLEAERDRLRELFEEANETRDVLAVQSELADVQEEIERLSARQQSLEEDVAFSTITIHLTEEPPEPDPVEEDRWYDTPVTSAFVESMSGVATTLRAIAVGFAYVLPFALVFGTPVVGALGLYWWRSG